MKKVIVKSSSVTFWNRPTIWDDFWITFREDPKHRARTVCLTVATKANAEEEAQFEAELNVKYPQFAGEAWYMPMLEAMGNSKVYINLKDGEAIVDTPVLFKRDIECAVDAYMKAKGYSGANCKWVKPQIVIQSVGGGFAVANEYLERMSR